MSSLPSALKSADASAVASTVWGLESGSFSPPSPSPRRTRIDESLACEVATSGLPSRLKSPVATPTGALPAGKVWTLNACAAAKAGVAASATKSAAGRCMDGTGVEGRVGGQSDTKKPAPGNGQG